MKVEIRGYQSIKDQVTVDIEGLTVITGESNIGKSAIIRAICALLTSQTGSDFINKNSSQSVVSIHYKDKVITWMKDRKTSSYVVNGEPVLKSGKSVPKEVEDLGFFEIISQGSKFRPQIQKQLEPLFILAETSPAIAAELLSASKQTAILTRAVKLAQKSVQTETSQQEFQEKSLQEVKKSREKAEPFKDRLSLKLMILKDLKSKIDDAKLDLSELSGVNTNYKKQKKLENATKVYKSIRLSPPPDNTKLKYLNDMRIEYQKNKKVRDLTNRVIFFKFKDKPELKDIKEWLRLKSLREKKLSFIDLFSKIPDLEKIESLKEISYRYPKLNQWKQIRDSWEQLKKQIATTESGIKECEKEIEILDAQRKTLLDSYEYCPFCGKK